MVVERGSRGLDWTWIGWLLELLDWVGRLAMGVVDDGIACRRRTSPLWLVGGTGWRDIRVGFGRGPWPLPLEVPGFQPCCGDHSLQ